jgi:hypothetical protein
MTSVAGGISLLATASSDSPVSSSFSCPGLRSSNSPGRQVPYREGLRYGTCTDSNGRKEAPWERSATGATVRCP